MVYLAGLDLAAFNKVPHDRLMHTLSGTDIDLYTLRFVETWLRSRRFSVRLTTPPEQFLSAPETIARGIPKGGVLSPCLRILHFNGLRKAINRHTAGLQEVLTAVKVPVRFYADDIVFTSVWPASDLAD